MEYFHKCHEFVLNLVLFRSELPKWRFGPKKELTIFLKKVVWEVRLTVLDHMKLPTEINEVLYHIVNTVRHLDGTGCRRLKHSLIAAHRQTVLCGWFNRRFLRHCRTPKR